MGSLLIDELCAEGLLGPFLESLRTRIGGYELLDHWSQGEFHHDVVIALPASAKAYGLPAVVVVATNCNGGIKEVLGFDEAPARWALWHHRCPDNPEFTGDLPTLRACKRTEHWFDPCCRVRGGGWAPLKR